MKRLFHKPVFSFKRKPSKAGEVKGTKGKRFSYLHLLWLIPVAVLGYIGWMNLLPLGGTLTYLVDVGGNDTIGKAYLTGPFDRISGPKEADGITFREMEKNLVYFELDSRLFSITDTVTATIRFKDNFPDNSSLSIGARDKGTKWSYDWKEIYAPFYQQVTALPLVTENADTKIYATNAANDIRFTGNDDFLQNPPPGSVIATNGDKSNINQIPDQAKYGIDSSIFAGRDTFSGLPANDTGNQEPLAADISLRGQHDCYFLANGGAFSLNVSKQDLNWYEGDDALNIIIYSLEGEVIATELIPDDGDITKSRIIGPSQNLTIHLYNLAEGLYILTIAPVVKGSDFVITHLETNQSKLVIPNQVFQAGNIYLGGDLTPLDVYCYLFNDGAIQFSTPHKAGLQNVIISGTDHDNTIAIDAVSANFSSGLLKTGLYKITAEKGDLVIKAPSGYFAFTETSVFVPAPSTVIEENNRLEINTPLRGGHTCWTYVANDTLELTVSKQDLNRYEGSDQLEIMVYSLDGELKGSTITPDDGDESKEASQGPVQKAYLKINDLEPGAYRIELTGNADLLIRGIEINQAKFVVDGSIFLAGTNPVYFTKGISFDPINIYTQTNSAGKVEFSTAHNQGLQKINIQGELSAYDVEIKEKQNSFGINLNTGDYQLSIDNQDLYIRSKGYFSFTPDSYFLPQLCKVIDLRYDLPWLKETADYLVVEKPDYIFLAKDNGWFIAEVNWNKDDLFITDDKLSLCLKIPYFSTTGESDSSIPIDWVEFNVKILPIYKR